MKILTLGSRIELKVDEPSVGGLNTSSMPTAIECAEVIGLGPDIKSGIQKGDKVFYKSWAVDIITYNGKKYYFIDEKTGGICAIIK